MVPQQSNQVQKPTEEQLLRSLGLTSSLFENFVHQMLFAIEHREAESISASIYAEHSSTPISAHPGGESGATLSASGPYSGALSALRLELQQLGADSTGASGAESESALGAYSSPSANLLHRQNAIKQLIMHQLGEQLDKTLAQEQ